MASAGRPRYLDKEIFSLLQKHRLTVTFGISALLLITVASLAIYTTVTPVAENNLITIVERTKTDDARYILSMIAGSVDGMTSDSSPSGDTSMDMRVSANAMNMPTTGSEMMDMQPSAPLTVEALAGPGGLPTIFPVLAAGFDVERLTLFDVGGRLAWSTGPDANADAWTNPLFAKAAMGDVTSKFVKDAESVDLSGGPQKVSVVETYMPIRGSPADPVVGVIHIVRDVTDDVSLLIDDTRTQVIRITALTMAGLFFILMMIVLAADRAMDRAKRKEKSLLEDRLAERKQAQEETDRRLKEALDELKRNHEQVVEQARLRALGEMASGIAHDFKESLTQTHCRLRAQERLVSRTSAGSLRPPRQRCSSPVLPTRTSCL